MDYMQKLIEALRTKMGQNVGYTPGTQASGAKGSGDDYSNYVAEASAMGDPIMPKEQWLLMQGGGQ